jgi:NAD(P)H-hydrate epimerase
MKKASKTISSKKARSIDIKTQKKYGISGLILMENAGLKAAQLAEKLLKRKRKKVLVLCGKGNNAGDGFVCARQLLNEGFDVLIYLLYNPSLIKGDAKVNYNILKKVGSKIRSFYGKQQKQNFKKIKEEINKSSLIIDAVFGIGFKGRLPDELIELFSKINALNKKLLALDVPSGLNADSGKANPICLKADYTITFGLAKKGFYKNQGPKSCGKVIIDSITFPKPLLI